MTIATTEQYDNTPAIPQTGSVGANLIREAAAVMADAHALATAIARTDMVPAHFKGKPDDIAAAMLYGASLNLDPMQALRAVVVVHGQPGLYARAMDALTKAAGHDVWTVESTDDSVTVAGQRKGSPHVEQVTWTIQRATKAGYVPTAGPDGKLRRNERGKVIGNEKYLTDPQAMLHAKATAEVCRKIAPDVLAGIYAVEEIESERVWAEQVQRPTRGLAAALQTSGAEPGAPTPAEPDAVPLAAGEHSAPEPDLSGDITDKTRGALFALLAEVGISDEDDQRRFLTDTLGREVASRATLTEAEGVLAGRRLRRIQQGDPDAEWTPRFDAETVPQACPDCTTGKHAACNGLTWDHAAEQEIPCPCDEAGHQ